MKEREAPARLRDTSSVPGSVEAAGIALLRQRDRHHPAAAAKARVRVALEARDVASSSPAAWRWRPVVVAAILLVGAAGSSASFGRQWVGAGYHRLLTLISPSAGAPTPPARHLDGPVGVPAAAREAAAAPPPAEAPVMPARARIERPLRHAPAPVAVRQEPKLEAAPKPTDDPKDEPTMVATAMRALRRDHDPARAARLLDDYLVRWPDGALVEEALALGIEAARARGDARESTLAAEYLRRFPSGRFADAARRALAPRPTP
jgi:hypothetical protein